MMTSQARINNIFAAAFLLILVMLIALLFGRILGDIYLGNILAGQSAAEQKNQGFDTAKNVRVLRLKTLKYYTIEAASLPDREAAMRLGNDLSKQGFPVIITGECPYRIKIGFLNDRVKLAAFAERIRVDGQKPIVVEGTINAAAYRFADDDTFAAEKIAPFLGGLSICLEKAILLNSDLEANAVGLRSLMPKFQELALEITDLSQMCSELASSEQAGELSPYLNDLTETLKILAESLKELYAKWNDQNLQSSQQKVLLTAEEYEKMLKARE